MYLKIMYMGILKKNIFKKIFVVFLRFPFFYSKGEGGNCSNFSLFRWGGDNNSAYFAFPCSVYTSVRKANVIGDKTLKTKKKYINAFFGAYIQTFIINSD